jgi:putative transcriptional regulator
MLLEISSNNGVNKDRQAIERLESGKANPTLYSLFEIAKGLEISIKELVDF